MDDVFLSQKDFYTPSSSRDLYGSVPVSLVSGTESPFRESLTLFCFRPLLSQDRTFPLRPYPQGQLTERSNRKDGTYFVHLVYPLDRSENRLSLKRGPERIQTSGTTAAGNTNANTTKDLGPQCHSTPRTTPRPISERRRVDRVGSEEAVLGPVKPL